VWIFIFLIQLHCPVEKRRVNPYSLPAVDAIKLNKASGKIKHGISSELALATIADHDDIISCVTMYG
jgi:hypothetical protein